MAATQKKKTVSKKRKAPDKTSTKPSSRPLAKPPPLPGTKAYAKLHKHERWHRAPIPEYQEAWSIEEYEDMLKAQSEADDKTDAKADAEADAKADAKAEIVTMTVVTSSVDPMAGYQGLPNWTARKYTPHACYHTMLQCECQSSEGSDWWSSSLKTCLRCSQSIPHRSLAKRNPMPIKGGFGLALYCADCFYADPVVAQSAVRFRLLDRALSRGHRAYLSRRMMLIASLLSFCPTLLSVADTARASQLHSSFLQNAPFLTVCFSVCFPLIISSSFCLLETESS